MTFLWTSPGGVYTVPDSWREAFLSEFPDYRVRWSLAKGSWHVEQRCGRGALPPFRIDPFDDSLIRARDGYWLVMEFQPGNRMPCPAITTRYPLQRCGWTLSIERGRSKEAVCAWCRRQGRDGRTMAAYWPFDETLLEHLRYSDPLRGGISRQRADADARNQAMLAEAERKRRDACTSIDAVDYRWLSGIGASGATRRQVDGSTFT